MKYLIVAFFGFLCYGCACFDIDNVEKVEELYKIVKKKKYFTILNHTDKTYTNNELFWIETIKINKVWKLIYDSEDYVDSFTYGYSSVVDKDTSFFYHKINTINPEVKINKNEIGNLLKLGGISSPPCHLSGYVELNLFLLSLDGGKRKMFFGDSYGALYQRHWGEITSDCKRHVIKYDVHPVWQEKELTIHIYEDKITFSDPKIKEVKKLKLTIDGEKTQEVDPNTLELVDCSKE